MNHAFPGLGIPAGFKRLPWPRHFTIAARPRLSYHCGQSAPVAQLDRALPSEGRGQGFESLRVHHFSRRVRTKRFFFHRGP